MFEQFPYFEEVGCGVCQHEQHEAGLVAERDEARLGFLESAETVRIPPACCLPTGLPGRS